jgi:hypothetical protein
LNVRRCQPSESRATAEWIGELHYLKSKPPGFVHVLEFSERDLLLGAIILGRPSSRGAQLNPDYVLEFNRVYLRDEAPKNTESQALAMARKHIRVWLPSIRLVIAYSDPSVGHLGTIYMADGWCPFGMTSHKTGYGWRSRPDRKNDPVTPKLRWVRTP